MIEYVINAAVKGEIDWATINGGTIPPVVPIYSNVPQDSPFIVYSWSDTTVSDEKYYQQVGFIRYFIYDTNIDRMNQIRDAIKVALNVGDNVNDIKQSYGSNSNHRLMFCGTNFGVAGPPGERDGTPFTYLEFKVMYV